MARSFRQSTWRGTVCFSLPLFLFPAGWNRPPWRAEQPFRVKVRGDIVVTGWKCQLAPNKASCDIWERATRNPELTLIGWNGGDPKLEPALSFPCLWVTHLLFMDFLTKWGPGAKHWGVSGRVGGHQGAAGSWRLEDYPQYLHCHSWHFFLKYF